MSADYNKSGSASSSRAGTGGGLMGRPGGGGGFGGGGPISQMGRAAKKRRFHGHFQAASDLYKTPYGQLIIVFSFAVISTVFSIVGPKIMGKATTKLMDGVFSKYVAYRFHYPVPSINFRYIGSIMLLLIVFYIISSVFSFVQQYVMAGVTQKIVYQMRKEISEKIAKLPLRYFD